MCYEAARRENPAELTWGKTGPHLLEQIVRENGLQAFVKPPEVFCPLDYWDWELLLAEDTNPAKPVFTPESYAIHLWHELWRRAGIKLDARTGEPRPGFFEALWQRLGLKPKPAQNGSSPFAELLRRYGLKK